MIEKPEERKKEYKRLPRRERPQKKVADDVEKTSHRQEDMKWRMGKRRATEEAEGKNKHKFPDLL